MRNKKILLDWEINWVRNHPERYTSKIHMESVIKNIEKEYKIKEYEFMIRKFRDTKTTGAYCELFEELAKNE